MDKIFVIGHKKPDTDAVCGTIALSYLKNQIGLNTEPRILSEINSESSFVLKKFNVKVPKYLNDVKVQIKDVKYKNNLYVNKNRSIYKTYKQMRKENVTGIPIVDDNKKYIGYVSLKELSKELVENKSKIINTSFDNIASTLYASSAYQFDSNIKGEIKLTNELDNHSILIGANEKLLKYALLKEVKLIILVNNYKLTEEEKKLIKENKVNVIVTPFDIFKVSSSISLSNPIDTIKREGDIITFEPNDYLTDFKEISNKYKHTNYPIVSRQGICNGMLRVIDTNEYDKKKLILVDHNELSQSVDGLAEAEILEIVDHHNIGNISTKSPINFRNMQVGSVNTVIYYMFNEQGVNIPTDIAGIMLSGIISDTLLFASPTTTKEDIEVANKLAQIADIDIDAYGYELLTSGVSIKGMKPIDVINKDLKTYIAGNHKIGVSQVFTTSFDIYKKNINSYIKELNRISENNNYIVLCLFVTDILNNNSYLIYNESAKKYLEESYGIADLKEGHFFEGVVSRKKQMVPLIIDVIESIK